MNRFRELEVWVLEHQDGEDVLHAICSRRRNARVADHLHLREVLCRFGGGPYDDGINLEGQQVVDLANEFFCHQMEEVLGGQHDAGFHVKALVVWMLGQKLPDDHLREPAEILKLPCGDVHTDRIGISW